MEAAIAAAVTALIAALLRFWEKRRKESGSVDTSDAAELWREAEKERAYLRRELDSIRADQLLCRASNHRLRNEVLRLRFLIEVPDIPPDVMQRLLDENDRHVKTLMEEADRLKEGAKSSRKSDLELDIHPE